MNETVFNFQVFLADSQQKLGYSDAQMADLLSVSRPTFSRWTDGSVMPHFAIRTAVVRSLTEKLEQEVVV